MWFYLLGAFLVVVGIVGGIATGGIFTLVFVPLGVIALLTAAGSSLVARSSQRRAGGSEAEQPLPHSAPSQSGHVPTSPEALADARRVQQ